MKNYLVGPNLIPETARPIVIRVTEFDEESAQEFSTQLSKAHETGQPVIPIVINSFGGDAYGLLSMIADIESSRVPVVTVIEGKAMSAGAFLFAFGRERYVAPDATVMIHDISSDGFGKAEEVKANAAETARLQESVFMKVAVACGRPPRYFLNIMDDKKHADWYLDAADAVKHWLATHVGVPEMRTTISIAMELVGPSRTEKRTTTRRALTDRRKGKKVTSKRT